MIERVTYERLYNLGNYENLKLAATATVEDGAVMAAWVEAKYTVVDQFAQFKAEQAEAQRRAHEEWEERQRMEREQRAAERKARDEGAVLQQAYDEFEDEEADGDGDGDDKL